MGIRRMLTFSLFALPVGLYTTFVLQTLWNWFVSTAFNVPSIPFWGMYGVTLLAGLLMDRSAERSENEFKWETALTTLNACIPEEKREAVTKAIKEQTEGVWTRAGSEVFAKAIGSTVTLVIGWIVHALAY
jgi:hypothetical protein